MNNLCRLTKDFLSKCLIFSFVIHLSNHDKFEDAQIQIKSLKFFNYQWNKNNSLFGSNPYGYSFSTEHVVLQSFFNN